MLYNTKVRICTRPDLENVRRLDLACMPMIAQMQLNGVRVDRGRLVSLNTKLTEQMAVLNEDITKLTGHRINPGSADQLSFLLFKTLKLKQNGREKWTKSKTRLAADSDVLKAMVSQHPCIRPILDWKEREKIRSTYTLGLAAKLDSDGRIHTDYSTTTAETGRLASHDPNLTNIPVRTQLGREVRDAFVPSTGNVLGSCDAGQIEMRQNAFDSQCKGLMDIFKAKRDVYWETAEMMYKRTFPTELRKCKCPKAGDNVVHVPDCKCVIHEPGQPYDGQLYSQWYRFNAKTTALMTAYDTSPGGLYDQFLITSPEAWQKGSQEEGESACAKIITAYFKAFPELLTRRLVHHKRAIRHMFVWDGLWGRIRWIPQVKSVHRWVVNEGLRAAGNMAGQGGAAGLIKLWMAVLQVMVENCYGRFGLLMLLQVHDELVVEGPRDVVEDFLQEASQTLRDLFKGYEEWYNVPLDAAWEVGDRWGAFH